MHLGSYVTEVEFQCYNNSTSQPGFKFYTTDGKEWLMIASEGGWLLWDTIESKRIWRIPGRLDDTTPLFRAITSSAKTIGTSLASGGAITLTFNVGMGNYDPSDYEVISARPAEVSGTGVGGLFVKNAYCVNGDFYAQCVNAGSSTIPSTATISVRFYMMRKNLLT